MSCRRWPLLLGLIFLPACFESGKSDDDDDDPSHDGDTAGGDDTADDGPGPGDAVTDVHAFLPLEGDRGWEYVQCLPADDACLPDASFDELAVDKVATEEQDGTRIVSLDYAAGESGAALYGIRWSSDATDGIRIWGWTDGTDPAVDLGTPVQVAGSTALVGADIDTPTAAGTFIATFVGAEACPNHWASEPFECLHFRIEGGDGVAPIVGDWWFSRSWGMVRHDSPRWAAPWVLSCAEYGGDHC